MTAPAIAPAIDPATLYGPNDHTFQAATDEDGNVRKDKEGRVLAVIALPGLGPEADAVLMRSGKGRELFLSAKERELAQREATIRAAEEEVAAKRAEMQRELDSLPAAVRRRLGAENA